MVKFSFSPSKQAFKKDQTDYKPAPEYNTGFTTSNNSQIINQGLPKLSHITP